MKRIKQLAMEVIAGLAIVLVLYGLVTGAIGSYFHLSEATGLYLLVFFVLLLVIDGFVIFETLAAVERD